MAVAGFSALLTALHLSLPFVDLVDAKRTPRLAVVMTWCDVNAQNKVVEEMERGLDLWSC